VSLLVAAFALAAATLFFGAVVALAIPWRVLAAVAAFAIAAYVITHRRKEIKNG
jgi:hypothetical protein